MAYELRKTADDKYIFNLKCGNGEVILSSKPYNDKTEARKGIENAQQNGRYDKNYESRTDSEQQYYFVLKDADNNVIGQSHSYRADFAVKVGIETAKKNCTSGEIKDHA